MAIDEIRSAFTVARWDNSETHPDALELWFHGVHSDVGGGYSNSDLSNSALLWMIEESEKVGLKFRQECKESIIADSLGVMHNSFKGAFAKLRSRPRNIEAIVIKNKDKFHPGVFERQRISPIQYPAYHPTTILKVNSFVTVDVYADTRWGFTGIYLEAGCSYTFSSSGQWLDSKDACNWNGT